MKHLASRLPWEQAFLTALAEGQGVSKSAKGAGISPSTAYGHRRSNARFAREWEKAFKAGGRPASRSGFTRTIQWKKWFLETLAETSNVSASAARVNVPVRTVYQHKRDDPVFAAKWLVALHEGYDNLEIELLGYLRDPQPKRKMEVAAALRLLAAHRETVERQRALIGDEEDEQAMLESLDVFLGEMRQRRFANTAILVETGANDGSE